MRLDKTVAGVLVLAALTVGAGCKRTVPAGGVATAASDPRDAQFAAFALNAGQNILAAARGQTHNPAWDGFDPSRDLRGVEPTSTFTLLPLGPNPELVAVAIELEAVASAMGAGGYLRSLVLVYPDGRVRWGELSYRAESAYARGTPPATLSAIAPPLYIEYTRMLEALGGSCNLPMVTPTDVMNFPPSQQPRALRDAAAAPGVCMQFRAAGQLPWTPRVDDVSVIVRGNSQWTIIRSGFDLSQGRLVLQRPRPRTPTAS